MIQTGWTLFRNPLYKLLVVFLGKKILEAVSVNLVFIDRKCQDYVYGKREYQVLDNKALFLRREKNDTNKK